MVGNHIKRSAVGLAIFILVLFSVFAGCRADEEGAQSLARRMCGKYACPIGENGTESDEYAVLHVVSFGDNLYALCGQAIARDDGTFEIYDFWASEFIPHDADDMRRKDRQRAKVRALCFSVMSNTGKYWGAGDDGTMTVTADGLLMEGFRDEFFSSAEHRSRLFLRDDRVEDAFPALHGGCEQAADSASLRLQGLWMSEYAGAPLFLEVKGGCLFIYRKAFDTEVFYAAGGYVCHNGVLTGDVVVLGHGNARRRFRAEYEVRKDRLDAAFDSETLPLPKGRCVFQRANPTDIPVVSMDDTD